MRTKQVARGSKLDTRVDAWCVRATAHMRVRLLRAKVGPVARGCVAFMGATADTGLGRRVVVLVVWGLAPDLCAGGRRLSPVRGEETEHQGEG